jgi:hypothetical protein
MADGAIQANNIDPVPRFAWMGILQAPLRETLSTLITPTLISLLDAWAGSRTIGKVIAPVLFQDGRYVAIIKRASLMIYLGGKFLISSASLLGKHIASMHNKIRDERYLLGVTLNNLNAGDRN